MTVAIISSEVKTSNGNLTIPATCTLVVALVLGTTNPTINSVAMTQKCSNGASISSMATPPTGTIACTVGQSTRFVYFSGAGSIRAGATAGTTGVPTYSVTIDTSSQDIVVGVSTTDSGTVTSITGGGSAMTYLDNYTRGYASGAGTTMACTCSSNGFSQISGAFASVQSTADDNRFMCMIM